MVTRCPECQSKDLKFFESIGSFGKLISIVCGKRCGWGEVINVEKLKRRVK